MRRRSLLSSIILSTHSIFLFGCVLFASHVLAADFIVPEGKTVGGQTLDSPFDKGTVQLRGTIRTTADNGIGILSQAENAQIIVNGTVNTTGLAAHGIFSLRKNAIIHIGEHGGIITEERVSRGIISAGENSAISNAGTIRTIESNADAIISVGANTSINHSGRIETSGAASDGIVSHGASTVINNSGSIRVTSGFSAGISSRGSNGHITNSGQIYSRYGNAIEFSGNHDDSLILLRGSVIEGGLQLGGGTDTLVIGSGLSIANTFSDKAPDILDTNGAPYAISGNVVAVVDPTSHASQVDQLAVLSTEISSALENRLSGLRNSTNDATATSGAVEEGLSGDSVHPFWMAGFGTIRNQEASGAATGTRQSLNGIVIGADGPYSDTIRAGIFSGGSWGTVESDAGSQNVESESVFAGAYASVMRGGLTIDIALTAGYSDFNQERRIANNLVAGGLETATSEFGGHFIAPEITLTKSVDILAHPFEGSLTARYAGLFLGGYTEDGPTIPLTGDRRNIHIGTTRLQLAAPNEIINESGHRIRYRAKAGLEARTNFGSNTFTGALLGQPVSFTDAGEETKFGAFAGLSAEFDSGGGLVLHASAEGLIEASGSSQIAGQVGHKIRF